MPDFTVRASAGVTIETWSDPASGAKPSRIYPLDGIPHLHFVVSGPVQLLCKTDVGAEAALDSTLAGRLFEWSWLEYPGLEPLINTAAPYSSKANFTAVYAGHYTLQVFRDGGGSVIIHFDKE